MDVLKTSIRKLELLPWRPCVSLYFGNLAADAGARPLRDVLGQARPDELARNYAARGPNGGM